MKKAEYGVHKNHCCKRHGCKYGQDDCPVASGEVEQLYPCESCGWEDGNRRFVLLKAAYDLLMKCTESEGYVLNVLEETAFYDGADFDGSCLMEDISNELGLNLE